MNASREHTHNRNFDQADSINNGYHFGKTSVVPAMVDPLIPLKRNQGALIRGYVDVPTTGAYSFYTCASSDGPENLEIRAWAPITRINHRQNSTLNL